MNIYFLKFGESKIESASGESPFPASWTEIFMLCPHMAEGMRDLSEVPFIKA